MTQKQAYCCLNCTASANCCGACGECPACCADCGDTSVCSSSAFLDKNDKLYLRYNYNSSYQYTDTYLGTDDVDCDYKRGSQTVLNINVNILFGEAPLFNGGYSFSNHDECCGLHCCYNDIGGAQMLEIQTSIKNNFSSTVTTSTPTRDYNDDCGVKTTTRSSEPYNGIANIIDGDFCTCGLCVDEQYEETHPWGIEIGRTKSMGRGVFSYFQEVKLYNSNGEEIEDPSSIISYPGFDPCNPIRNVFAPSCHFFAP